MRSALRKDYFVRFFDIGRWVDVDDLVGTNEIADRLDYSRGEYISQMYNDRDVGFPAPVATISGVYVWLWSDVEAWAVATGRKRRVEKWRENRL